MSRMVTHQFTMDNTCVYTVNNGVITKELRDHSLDYYANTEQNVGYLDPDKREALMIRDNDISRISYDVFSELRQLGVVSPSDIVGVISIMYDTHIFDDKKLIADRSYKESDRKLKPLRNEELPESIQELARLSLGREVSDVEIRVYQYIIRSITENGGKFDAEWLDNEEYDIFVLMCSYNIQYTKKGTEHIVSIRDQRYLELLMEIVRIYNETFPDRAGRKPSGRRNSIPEVAQELAKEYIGRTITEIELNVYKSIIDSIENYNGSLKRRHFNTEEDKIFGMLIGEGIVSYKPDYDEYAVSIPDRKKFIFMKKIVSLCGIPGTMLTAVYKMASDDDGNNSLKIKWVKEKGEKVNT